MMLIDVEGLREQRKKYKHGIKQIDRLLKYSEGIDLELNGTTPGKAARRVPKRHMSAAVKARISRAMKARHREKKQAATK